MRVSTAILLIQTMAGATAVTAAPFGIPQGTSIKALRVQEKYDERHFLVAPPKTNPNFADYVATATPTHGVCALTAITEKFATFEPAYEKQERVEKLLSIYGRPHHVRPSDRADWLNMAPSEGPVEWNKALPNNISSIVIETVKEAGKYQVELHYFYDNFERCSNWEPHQDRDAL